MKRRFIFAALKSALAIWSVAYVLKAPCESIRLTDGCVTWESKKQIEFISSASDVTKPYAVVTDVTTKPPFRLEAAGEYVSDGHYNWTVSVKADANELNRIRDVDLLLPQGLSDMVRRVPDAESPYRFILEGLGEVLVTARLHLKDGTMTFLTHHLTPLSARQPASTNQVVATKNLVVLNSLSAVKGENMVNWDVFLEVDGNTLHDISAVEYFDAVKGTWQMIDRKGTSTNAFFFRRIITGNLVGLEKLGTGIRIHFLNGADVLLESADPTTRNDQFSLRFELKRGRIFFENRGKPGEFEIRSPTASGAVRG